MNGVLLPVLTLIMVVSFSTSFIIPVHAQSILNITEVQPCFLNYTATGLEMLQNCNFSGDFLTASTLSFDWVTGGLFPMIVVTVLIVATYLKYQTGIYPIAIGIMFLPYAAWSFPDEFISYALVIAAVIGAGAVLNAIIKQTKEY